MASSYINYPANTNQSESTEVLSSVTVAVKKKRQKNPQNWQKTKRTIAILSGQSYVNTKGVVVPSKAPGPDCNCRNKCYNGVTQENRINIFRGFYKLNSYDEQNAYLYGLIRRHDVARKRNLSSDKRTCSYKYFVRVQGKEIQVCKKAFASIHGITDKKIRTLCLKHERNVMFPRDNRGRHCNRPKRVSPAVIQHVKQHIVQALSGPSAANFLKTDKNQAVPEVNISRLHKNYLKIYEPQAIDSNTDKIVKNFDTKVKTWIYFKVFHEEFDSLDFNSVKRKLADLRRSLEVSHVLPSHRKCESNKMKNRTRNNLSLSVDLCKTNNEPRTKHSSYSNFRIIKANLNSTNAAGVYEQKADSNQSCVFDKMCPTLQQQPLNLQINSSNTSYSVLPQINNQSAGPTNLVQHFVVQNSEESSEKHTKFPDAQVINNVSRRVNVQGIPIPTNGQPFCVSLSNIPNIITIPPSSCTTVLNVSANKLSVSTSALITATLVNPNSYKETGVKAQDFIQQNVNKPENSPIEVMSLCISQEAEAGTSCNNSAIEHAFSAAPILCSSHGVASPLSFTTVPLVAPAESLSHTAAVQSVHAPVMQSAGSLNSIMQQQMIQQQQLQYQQHFLFQ